MTATTAFGIGANTPSLAWWYPNLDIVLDTEFLGIPVYVGASVEVLTSGSAGIELYPDVLNVRSYFSVDADFNGSSLLATVVAGGYSRELSYEYAGSASFAMYAYNSVSFEYAGTILPKVVGDGLIFSYAINHSSIKEVIHGNIKSFNNNKIIYNVKANKIDFDGRGKLSAIFDASTKH